MHIPPLIRRAVTNLGGTIVGFEHQWARSPIFVGEGMTLVRLAVYIRACCVWVSYGNARGIEGVGVVGNICRHGSAEVVGLRRSFRVAGAQTARPTRPRLVSGVGCWTTVESIKERVGVQSSEDVVEPSEDERLRGCRETNGIHDGENGRQQPGVDGIHEDLRYESILFPEGRFVAPEGPDE